MEEAVAPRLERRRSPTGPLLDRRVIHELVGTGTFSSPTALVIDLEDSIPSSVVLHELVVGVGTKLESGFFGSLAVIIASPDRVVRDVIRALAAAHGVPLYIAESSAEPWLAEPALPLTPIEEATRQLVGALGGRVTVSEVAEAAGLDHTAAGNRLAGLSRQHFLFRQARAPRFGHLYIDPLAARPAGFPQTTSPTSGIPF